jgi:hypothetical protein
MESLTAKRPELTLLVVAVAITIWGIVGFFEHQDNGWGAYTYSPDYIVNFVEPGGAGDEAGLQIGDRVISVEGIPVEELPLYSRWPHSLAPQVGETLRIVVEREDATVAIDVVYGEPPRNLGMRLGAAVIGLAFMAFGLWALFTVQTVHALTLACIGLAAGLAVSVGPYLGTWDGVASHVQFASAVLLTLLLLRFFLTFPKPKRLGASRLATWAVYGAWLLFVGCLILELIFHPRLYHTFGPIGSLLMLGYILLTLIALTHTVVTTPRNELRASGMGLIIVGILVAIVPSTIAVVSGFAIPGSGYFPLLIVAIPLTMALAVRRQARLEIAEAG